MHYFLTLFGKELYMFRTDLLSIISNLALYTQQLVFGLTSYVDCLLARSGWNCEYSIKTPDDGQ
jgi:hypothetical protein